MRKNYFAKLVKYMKNVYHIERGLNKLSDGRVNPTYSTGQVILPVLFGFLLRIKSFNELNLMIRNNEFSKLLPRGTKLPQVDAIRDTLKVMDINELKQVNQHIVKKAIENKAFENGTIDGYTVVAIDGTKFFGSNKMYFWFYNVILYFILKAGAGFLISTLLLYFILKTDERLNLT